MSDQTSPTDEKFVHLVCGDSAAGAVKQALRILCRDEEVIAFTDPHHMGPLTDVDDGGALRADWWARIGSPQYEGDDRTFDDRATWERLRNESRSIAVWHGTHPAERLLALRACSQLRSSTARVHEVSVVAPLHPRLPYFYGGIGIQKPEVSAEAWANLKSMVDMNQRADEWERMRSKPGDWIREMDGSRFIDLHVDEYDARLVTACGTNTWSGSLLKMGTVLAAHPVGDGLLCWRLKVLIGAGILEGRGAPNHYGLPEELRASDHFKSLLP